MKDELRRLIGNRPQESKFKSRMRFHQGWWRAFVLAEDPGLYPNRKEKTICNTLANGCKNRKNFLTQTISKVVDETIENRQADSSGIIEEGRLFDNLLSSQPLAFNFFGAMKRNTALALQVIKQFYPEVTSVSKIIFEFAPAEKYTQDNSAFDVAFEVAAGNKIGLIGIECKFTDTFSQKMYDKTAYRNIYQACQRKVFGSPYEDFITGKFNQLFRNQLIAEALIQNGQYDFVLTGLFCHQDDDEAQETALEFQNMLIEGKTRFTIATYRDFIEAMQRLDLSWEQRELSMLLWARFCGMQLSQQAMD